MLTRSPPLVVSVLVLDVLAALTTSACSESADVATAPDAGLDDGATIDGGDGTVQASPAENAAWQALLSDAQKELTSSGTPGASIAVVLHGKLTFAAGIGKKNVATSEAVTTSTLFRAASMSKMIVAAT